MHDREKAKRHRGEAPRLNEAWGVGAAQTRYSDTGHWYETLKRFPAALFDPHGYVLFPNEAEYRAAPMSIGKQISVPKPGISSMPGYVRMTDRVETDGHRADTIRHGLPSDIEGLLTEVAYLKRKRSRSLRDLAFRLAAGICAVCDRDFSKLLNGRGVRVLQVHHRRQLSAHTAPALTSVDDLAVVCANCHMLLHLDQDKALRVEELRDMLAREGV